MGEKVLQYYRKAFDKESNAREHCFNIETDSPLTTEELKVLQWLLSETFEPEGFSEASFLTVADQVIEIGPRLNFATAWNTNALSVLRACGITKVTRIERSRRIAIVPRPFDERLESFLSAHFGYDRMTEMVYPHPLKTFETGMQPEPVRRISIIEEGQTALQKINTEMGLGMDSRDIEYYSNMFAVDIGRNPTNVECFDLGQCNSDHSRHWFFNGKIVINGNEMPHTLFQLVKAPWKANPGNSIIAFHDNSSAIKGYQITTIIPEFPGRVSRFKKETPTYHIIFTAETHNFPTGVAPFPGAETGTGGRVRDVHATGKGSLVVAGTTAYCVGNLLIPGYDLPWEKKDEVYPENLAPPLQIEIDASNGASDYGNKFGEPVIQGFTRSFGMRLPDGSRQEYVKPIMFTGGIGQIDSRHTEKVQPERGMKVVKIGGPAYRIGVGGGAASSMIQGENTADLDFNAVQRGDAEMEQKVNRVIRACVEKGEDNPVVSIHDQGAGGNCNVVKEIVYPAGAKIELREIPSGDATLSVLEIWGAEAQEQDALLIMPDRLEEFETLCQREKVPCAVIGEITGDGHIVLYDETDGSTPVNLDLSKVLGEMPQKVFTDTEIVPVLNPLVLPENLYVREALNRVLRLLSVGSKRFLTNKVDRSVTGLVVRQPCCGSLQLTVSDVAVIAQSHFGLTGAVMSIGERAPIGIINPEAMARMAVAEALTNIMWARVSKFEDIRFSGNWMWAARQPGEAARMYKTAEALRDILIQLGLAIDGGKDSCSLAAKVTNADGTTEIVKSPGTLVMSAYCTVPDIRKVITPDIKKPGESRLIFIDLSDGKKRLGGSALAQCYGQIGDECPDVGNVEDLEQLFLAIRQMIDENLILSGHDVSDGGVITTLLEMAFAGNCGLDVGVYMDELERKNPVDFLFAEEAGVVIEILPDKEERINRILADHGLSGFWYRIAASKVEKRIIVRDVVNQRVKVYLDEDMRVLRDIWEETSYRLQVEQKNLCAKEEKSNIRERPGLRYVIKFDCVQTAPEIMALAEKPRVAIIREEGSNGDREMTSAFYQAGFECWDVTMTDLLEGRMTLEGFRGIVFVGGFSYADVLDSAKGWAGVIRFNEKLRAMFDEFRNRPDTFSLGVCNGCQLMALLGWVPFRGLKDSEQPRFIKNKSGRFESRFSLVEIRKSPAIMLKGMEGSRLGVWVAHGEGRIYFPDMFWYDEVMADNLAPIRFIDDFGFATTDYPFNPNGSVNGVTALCSPDGRHLAMMPHPERAFIKWQWAYAPEGWKDDDDQTSPWLWMFQNARIWCEETK
jgi:phosphoribosylformylglycinamidine synthase